MMTTGTEHLSLITVSVGHDIRVREGQKSGTGDGMRAAEKRLPVFSADSKEEKSHHTLLNQEHLQENVDRLQHMLKHVDPRIEISLEKDINRVIFRVMDKESGDLIRQIPPEKIVELDRFLSEHSGLLVEEAI